MFMPPRSLLGLPFNRALAPAWCLVGQLLFGLALHAEPLRGDFSATGSLPANGALVIDLQGSQVGVALKDGVLTTAWPASGSEAASRWNLVLPTLPKASPLKVRLVRQGDRWTSAYSLDGQRWETHLKERLPALIGPAEARLLGATGQLVTASDDGRVGDFLAISPQDSFWTTPIPEMAFIAGRLKTAIAQKRFEPESAANPLGYKDGVPLWLTAYKNPSPLIPDLDIPGPGGLIYPNFTYAGVQGGIPQNLPVRATLTPDAPDFAAALEAAIATAAAQGGGVIQLEAGTYQLKRPVGITDNNIVLRGRGPDRTRIEFTFTHKPKTIGWFSPRQDDADLAPEDLIEVHADLDSPADGTDKKGELTLMIDGKLIMTTKWKPDEPSQFRVSTRVRTQLEKGLAPGKHTLTAQVRWKDGTTTTESRQVTFNPALRRKVDAIGAEAAFTFTPSLASPRAPLTEYLPRGARRMKAPQGLVFRPGDFLTLRIGADPDWMRLVKAIPMADGTSWLHRQAMVQVTKVENGELEFNQPLRIPFESVPSATVANTRVLTGCGVEDLTLTSTEKNWLHGVMFRQVVNSWIRNVHFLKLGRNSFETDSSKWVEIRDVEAHDAWFKAGGGTAYISFSRSFDCLIDGLRSSKLRHGPNLSWSSSGCVFRNGHYEDSDAQLHCGWPNENLFENNTIISRRGNGSYGFGFFAQSSEADIHGPQGPRNVLYNNDVTSDEAGLWLGGSNEGYLFVYNRFIAKNGPAIFLKQGSFDHTFLGNVFITLKPGLAAVLQATPDCVGNDYIGNTFGGLASTLDTPRTLFAGAAAPHRNEGNTAVAATDLPRPVPQVPSLYLWQLAQKRAAQVSE